MKKAIVIAPIIGYVILLATIPGLWEYLQLRYFKGIKPENIESAVAAMQLTSKKMNEELEISTHITADEIRRFDGDALRNFYSELNRSIDVEYEFAFARSFGYYAEVENGQDVNGIKEKILSDISEDYFRFREGPRPESNSNIEIIERIAKEEHALQALIDQKANKPVESNTLHPAN